MQPVERAEYEGVDYAWVMQTTFVVTILVGAPAAALLSTLVALESWGARAAFAVRVGAPIWFVTAVAVALYAKRTEASDGGEDDSDGDGSDDGPNETDDEPDGSELDGDDTEDPATDDPPGGTPTEAERDD
ncbi:hypothetical protein BRD22_02950 [Halobacteriales archaeon SW_8_68_21]|nr:MAG: hypothetical protein BRD22_02950 [Halobacteriales archaeon SW_8_68_21]